MCSPHRRDGPKFGAILRESASRLNVIAISCTSAHRRKMAQDKDLGVVTVRRRASKVLRTRRSRLVQSTAIIIGSFVILFCLDRSNIRAQEHQSLDILAYCRRLYGSSAGDTQIRTEVYSWSCTVGARRFPLDLTQICVSQYGSGYVAQFDDPHDSFSWYCIRK